jgi:hypothetical protein
LCFAASEANFTATKKSAMPELLVHPSFPNILIVYGPDLLFYDDMGVLKYDKLLLMEFLRNRTEGPVTKFSHDFWITHPVGTWDRNFTYISVLHEPATPTMGARDFRGLIQMGFDLGATVDVQYAQDYYSALIHELGHYWLVPEGVTFRGLPMLPPDDFSNAFLERRPFPYLQLRGRDGDHWTSHMQENHSPMDGLPWSELETIPLEGTQEDPNILRKYESPPWLPTTNVPGIGDLLDQRFTPLDRVLMGLIRPEDAYPQNGNGFYELYPQWASPVNFHGGLVLAFSAAEIVIFGFDRGFNHIGISQTGEVFPEHWDISAFYKPWQLASRIIFRVVRRGNDYYFQAKQQVGTNGCLAGIFQGLGLYTPPPAVDPFSDTETLSPPNPAPTDLQSWTTLKVLTRTSTVSPIAVGYGVKTWAPSAWVDMNFRPLMIRHSVGTVTVSTNPAGIRTVTGELSNAISGVARPFVFHRPTPEPRLSGDASSCNLVVTADTDNWAGIPDHMPKLLTGAPFGDFVAAGSVRITRNCLAPWAAGAYVGTNLWATRKKISVADIALDPERNYRLQDPGRPYKAAYMLIAQNREQVDALISDGTQLRNLDLLRTGLEPMFRTATGGYRTVTTVL